MLNNFNRVVTVLTLLGVIACAGLSAVNALLPSFLHPLRERGVASIAALAAAPDALPSSQRFLLVAVALLIAVGAFLLLIMELRAQPKDDAVRVKGGDGSETVIARSAITQRIQHAVDRLDDVLQVATLVKGKGEGLSIHLDVTTAPYIDVPMKTEEIRAATREVIEQQMGLVLKKVTVKLDHEERYGEASTDEPI